MGFPLSPASWGTCWGAYLQRGSMEDNALSEPHALAHSHPLPNGDVGAQLWRGTYTISPGGLGGPAHNGEGTYLRPYDRL